MDRPIHSSSNTYALMELVLTQPETIEQLALDADWRVRYAAAVAIGRAGDPRRLPLLSRMLEIEDARPLYRQPPARFINSSDDTRMAEQIGPIEVIFDQPYDEFHLEAWRCRGRVRQAILFAVAELGATDAGLRVRLEDLLRDPAEDYPVKAAAARALAAVGDAASLPALEAARQIDEWCTQVEAAKAIRSITHDTPA